MKDSSRVMPSPSPHPLDFDWRYDDATARMLAAMLKDNGPVLTLGAPSVARALEGLGVDVTLVDRQPIQGVTHQIPCDAAAFVPHRLYRSALVDPPWYLTQLEAWTTVAARSVGVGGTVFVSVWPIETRPTALSELTNIFRVFSAWAEVKRDVAVLRYAIPHFEVIARRLSELGELSHSPLNGELVCLRIERIPPVTS